MRSNEYLLAIDLGTTKVCAAIARKVEGHPPEIIGVGVHPAEGLERGAVVDLELTTASIEAAVSKAVALADVEITRAWVGVAGSFVQSYNSTGSVAVANSARGITRHDVNRAIRGAIERKIPAEMKPLHTIERGFRVDDNVGIKDPTGMHGNLLEVDVHLVTGQHNALQNIERCICAAGLRLEGIVLEPIASSLSVLSLDERQAGIAMCDIGGGTCDLAVYYNGSILHSEVILIGGDYITRDIAAYFASPPATAENLKKNYGCAMQSLVDPHETVEVVRLKPRAPKIVERRKLAWVVELRVEQILQQINNSLQSRKLADYLVGGLVLTGGCALLHGIREKAQEQLGLEVQIGYPSGVTGFADVVGSPVYATAVGLIHYGFAERERQSQAGGRNIWHNARQVAGRLMDYIYPRGAQ